MSPFQEGTNKKEETTFQDSKNYEDKMSMQKKNRREKKETWEKEGLQKRLINGAIILALMYRIPSELRS